MGEGLLIADCGHSRIKLHCYRRGRVGRGVLARNARSWPEGGKFRGACAVILMGTDSGALRLVRSLLGKAGEKRPVLLGKDAPVPVRNLCRGAGNDRLAQALGAAQLFPGRSCLIVGAGSALVMDYVDRKGRFKGGLIGLGLSRYIRAMAGISRKLAPRPEADGAPAPWPAGDTQGAVMAGWLIPALAAIRELREKKKPDAVILTGGDAGVLAGRLRGVRLIADLGPDAVARHLGHLRP